MSFKKKEKNYCTIEISIANNTRIEMSNLNNT